MNEKQADGNESKDIFAYQLRKLSKSCHAKNKCMLSENYDKIIGSLKLLLTSVALSTGRHEATIASVRIVLDDGIFKEISVSQMPTDFREKIKAYFQEQGVVCSLIDMIDGKMVDARFVFTWQCN